jgi:RNA polymerase sigma-70 factor (ECF subfamily)
MDTSLHAPALRPADLAHLRDRLLRHARQALPDTATAEDLVQDTLVVVLEGAQSHRGEASLRTWATAILKHKVADWYRSPARRHKVSLEAEDERLAQAVEGEFDESGSWRGAIPAWQQPEQAEEQRQMRGALQACLDRLPAQTGRIFVLREWLGFETDEISTRLGLSSDNVRQILHRARMGLRGCMQSRWVGQESPSCR